jgi:hypothetical protein
MLFLTICFSPVLATSHIRPLNQAFKSTFICLSHLADSQEQEYNRNAFICSFSKGVRYTVHGIHFFIKRLTNLCFQSLRHRFRTWTKPDTATSLMVGTLTDLLRSKSELVAENALLRKPLIILRRHIKRPVCANPDRLLLVLLAKMVRTWKQALFIVQPETLLRWHRQGFKLYWKYKSRAAPPKPKISPETVAFIKEMARDNRLWGAERIRGELLKLGLRVCLPHDPEIHETGAHCRAARTELENLLTDSCPADLDLRLSPGHRLAFPVALCLLHHRITLSPSDPCRRHTITHRCVDGATAAGSHRLWHGAEVPHPGS